MEIVEIVLGIVIALGVLYSGIWVIVEFDKDTRISYKPSLLNIGALIIGIVIVQRSLVGVDYWFFVTLIGYLVLSAYTDMATMLLYSLFSYIFMVIGIGYSIMNEVNTEQVGYMVGFVVFAWVLGKIKVYGEGDSEVFAVSGVFITNLVSSEYHIYLLSLIFLASIVAAVMGLARIKVTKESLRTKMPFAPGIGVAVLVLVSLFIV